MKKIKYSIAALSLFLAIGCTNDAEDFNNNKDRSYDVPAETLLTNAQRELVDQMTTPEVNLNPFRFFVQYWAATQYPQESRYNLTQRTVPDNLWDNLFRDVLGNLETAKDVINQESRPNAISEADWAIQQSNKIAIVEILEVYTFQILVDTFGDIPYTEALDPINVLPKYDDDATIYPKLITRLDVAIAALDDTQSSFASGDLLYDGDVSGWKLFANSLKVKLGINLADVDDALARTTIESAVTAGVILTNADNTVFAYNAAPFYNPLYAQLVASNRNDFVASSTIVDKLNELSDERRSAYFSLKDGAYVGGLNGGANTAANFSAIGEKFRVANYPATLFDAAEVNFYLAEAAARGYSVGGTAETFYNTGIETSFEFWGVSGSVAAYLANPDVAYTTAEGDWKQKIGIQAWLALFNRPFEAWTSYRRLDVPSLIAATGAVPAAEGLVPIRFTYPINEFTVNRTNVEDAIDAMGGNKLQTRIFWDVD